MAGIQFSGLASGLDTENIIKELMKAERTKVEKVEKEKTKLEWKKEIWEDMNKEIYDFYTGELFDLKSSGTYQTKKASSSNDSALEVTATTSAIRGVHTVEIGQLAQGSFLTGDQITSTDGDVTSATTVAELTGVTEDTEITFNVNGNPVKVKGSDNLATLVSTISKADDSVNVSFDSNFDRIFLSSKETGEDATITLGAGELEGGGSDPNSETLLTALGFDSGNRVGTEGQNAIFSYNGTQLTSSSNEVTVNGMRFNFKATTTTIDSGTGTIEPGEPLSISVTQDTEAVYEKVKSFVLKYNELMMELNEKINADSARGYEPLTSEEKEAMSDKEIELWESKIKDSLLRRDDILSGVTSSMRSILTSSSGVDTSSLPDGFQYLSDIGIVTGSYTEKGLLHIEGDEDDSLYSAKENKLMKAIEENPDEVAELLNAVGNQLYSTLQDKMKSTTLSSALTFYNDKQIDKQIDDYEDRIEQLENKLSVTEDRYYRQFTAMEQAIQKMNSQSASLASMLGGGA